MGKGSSESNTTSSSSTTQADQRVAADSGGIAIGAGAQYNPTTENINNFPQQVADFANKLLDFSSGVLTAANDVVAKSISAGETATNAANSTAAAAVNNAQLGNANVLQNALPLIIIGAVAFAFIGIFKKKG